MCLQPEAKCVQLTGEGCSTIDDRAMSLPPAETQVVYVAAGRHTLEATFDDTRTATREIAAVVGADSEIGLVSPRSQAAPGVAPAAPLRSEPTIKREQP